MPLNRLFAPLLRGAVVTSALAALVACEGDNLYRSPTDGTVTDDVAPSISFVRPDPDQRIAAGDSVLVQVQVEDNHAVASIEIAGFARSGDPDLGTDQLVQRFATRTINLNHRAVTDTVLTRYLLALPDTSRTESAFLVAVVQDSAGNTATDTVRVSIGGPRVQIVSPFSGSEVRAGGPLRVSISASDSRSQVDEIRVRLRGATSSDATIFVDPPASVVDTAMVLQLPESARGEMDLTVVALTAHNDSAVATIQLEVLQPIADNIPPSVTFNFEAPANAERGDSVSVTVTATDSTRVDRVGVTVLPLHRLGTGTDTLSGIMLERPGDQATFQFSLAELGLPVAVDTSALRLEITAFAFDAAGNCAVATIPGTSVSEICHSRGGRIHGNRSGARADIRVFRGATVRLESATDRIADIASDGRRVFLSNLSRNRLEVIPVGENRITNTIAVGSQPWGLAFNRAQDRLYVANSGGTNISVVSPSQLRELPQERIQTPNVKLFDVTYSVEEEESLEEPPPAGEGEDEEEAPPARLIQVPSEVVRYDYSDRPQYIGVTDRNNLIYSTKPTGAAPDGTIRFWHSGQRRLEMVTSYAGHRFPDKAVIVNADSAYLVLSEPQNMILVYPRPRSATGSTLPIVPFLGFLNDVAIALEESPYDTRILYNIDIEQVGLSDTTFVAVSGDHSTVAFGEGAVDDARIMVFEDRATGTASPLLRFGETQDLVGNTAERVIGLALNLNGSMGIARGRDAYYFSKDLRLQGTVETTSQSGGVAMHPLDPSVRRSFVSGVQDDGLAYIDVIDTFHYRRESRIYMRDPVTGPIRAVRRSDGGVTLYAVTDRGVVAVDVNPGDL